MNEFFILSSRECIFMLFGDAMKICNIAARLYAILTVLIAGFFMTFFSFSHRATSRFAGVLCDGLTIANISSEEESN